MPARHRELCVCKRGAKFHANRVIGGARVVRARHQRRAHERWPLITVSARPPSAYAGFNLRLYRHQPKIQQLVVIQFKREIRSTDLLWLFRAYRDHANETYLQIGSLFFDLRFLSFRFIFFAWALLFARLCPVRFESGWCIGSLFDSFCMQDNESSKLFFFQ